MGSNNNNNKNQPNAQYGSGGDPRGRVQNQSAHQQERYENQQGPLANAMSYNYGRGSEADYGNYTDIMNQYRDIASGANSGGGGGGGISDGGGGGGGYDAFTVDPERVSAERISSRGLGPLERVTAKDTFGDPYAGYQEFSQSGGYSPTDIANMRARGVAPIRAAYSNAERAVGQQRGLQGGYSPNAIAAQVKMAREQGQSMADASQNVDAGIASARNAGRLAGFGGMSDIAGQRLNAQMQGDIFNAGQSNEGQKFDIGNELDTSKFNSGQGLQAGMFNSEQGLKAGMYNADAQTQAQARNNAAGEAAASRRAAASAADMDTRMAALSGMRSLYGTTPGMSELFGNQASNIVGQGGTFGLNLMGRDVESQGLPGQFDQTTGRINQIGDMVSRGANVASGFLNDRPQTSGGYTGAPMNTGGQATFQPGGASTQQRRRLTGGITL